ncbi:MAG: M1 family aminopeptidase [Bacteroidota bacterium]
MFEFIKFELKYRATRPATYIYFGLLFLMAFLLVVTDAQIAVGATGKIKDNAPSIITGAMQVIMFFGIFIASAVMGVSVLRDYEHKMSSIIFSTPIKKLEYLAGKFIGSFIILILISSGLMLGLMLGQGVPWPWLGDSKDLLPFNFMAYLSPFLIFIIPNLFAFGSIFFAGGTLAKNMVTVYAQGIVLFMGYLVASSFLGDLDNQYLAALFDPFGLGAQAYTTQYWTISEQNSKLLSLSGVILQNRLIWFGVGVFALVITAWKFSFNLAGKASKKQKKSKKSTQEVTVPDQIKIPLAQQLFGFSAEWTQLKELSIFYFKWVIKQGPFIFISLAGIIFVLVIAFVGGTQGYDIELYATSSRVLDLIGIFNLFFIILAVFYTAEIIWKERDVKMNLIYDALPYPNYVSLLSKFFGMVLMSILLLIVLMFTGILIQFIKGYPEIDSHVYFNTLFVDTLFMMVLYVFLGIFIQTVVNHKFLGIGLMIVFYISLLALGQLGVEHNMFYFARASIGTYSEMNDFGHYLSPFSWFNAYWFGLAIVFFGLSILFSVRGMEASLKNRLKLGKLRLNKRSAALIAGSLLIFMGSGSFIYYNTNVLNVYRNSDEQEALQADYERELKRYQDIIQPKIVDTYVEVDIMPFQRDFVSSGYYILKNKSKEVINQIHIQKSPDYQALTTMSFEPEANVKEEYEKYGYTIFDLNKPLQPGESVRMNFKVEFTTTGFREGDSNNDVVFNGTFFNNSQYFPSIGYSSGFELGDDDTREDNDLEPKERLPERDDRKGIQSSLFGDDADKISFEIIVSTDSSQMAIAPGYLQKQWDDGARSYYHYKMDTPMVNFYSVMSADYEVIKDTWKPPVDTLPEVSLEIYYNKGHEYNTDRMMKGMKESLTYYTENFSPFQFRQLRIMEFPRYRSFAQSFANTVPFSEAIGFIQQIKTNDVDLPFYVTAHEVAHQWWGHQVTEAGVKGNAMLSETMSQYSALMVMKQHFPPEIIKEFLRHELNSYLIGRTFEQKKEQPLEFVEGQGYIHYRKGSLIMYALQDYIGEDSVNIALKRFVNDWGFKDAPYPTSKDLLGYFKEVTPDSLQYLYKDMFETITLFENKTEEAEFTELPDGKYKVDLTVSSIKYRADSLGTEDSIPLDDWIDIGVFAKDEDGKDKLIYLEKKKIDKEENEFEIIVSEKPEKAGIDPINKLIDRNPSDNVKDVEEAVSS